jgi:hypothetical protein
MLQDRSELIELEEALPHVVLSQQRDVGHRRNQAVA